MTTQHMKTIAAPASWPIKRKTKVWITKLKGPHKLEESLPINTILKEILKLTKTTREVRYVLHKKGVFVNGIRIKDERYGAGIMDLIEIPALNLVYRILFDKRGMLFLMNTKEKLLPLKIIGKKKIGKKTQLNLFNGWNVLVDGSKNYAVGDAIVFEIPEKKIKEHIKFEKGSRCYLIGGKHVGEIGIITKIDKKIFVKIGEEDVETLKKFIYVIGNNTLTEIK